METYINTVQLNPIARSRLKAFGKEMSKANDWSTEVIECRLNIEPYEDADTDNINITRKAI